MNKTEKMLITKSIMYKIISLGYSVYVDDWDGFIINVLVCSKCGSLWNKSRTECFYCGVENFHIYTCTKCGKQYSITNAGQKCATENCSGILVKKCINPECPSNKIVKLQKFLIKKGGVFQKGKSGSCYNEMRCKTCGNKSSIYISKQVVIVDSLSDKLNDIDKLYIKKNTETDFDVIINGEKQNLSSIEEIIEKAFLLKARTSTETINV